MSKALVFGGTTVEPGEKRCIKVPFAKRADGTDMYFPLMVVNGKEDGPDFLVTAGVHGDEYDGVEAVRTVYSSLDPSSLKGSYIGVPVANVLAFEEGKRASMTDGANLNRSFPGKKEGFYTQRLAAVLFEEIVSKATCCIDLHGGGNVMYLEPMAIYRDIGPAGMGEKALELAKWSGADYIWNGGGGWGGSLSIEAQLIGVPTVTVELGGEGRLRDHLVKRFVTMINNILVGLKQIEGKIIETEKVSNFTGTFICSNSAGFYHQYVDTGLFVKSGQLIAEIKDYFGESTERIFAPYDGVVLSKRTFATIEAGGWTFMVGKIVD